ncbi:DALR anticodon-binding domain-containing protein [Pantanalinema rosaneae CENA516]|uniref:DALR anticodon-binding domain-containing protein n=1 Tax=Pantanalinema rosaneae TaxID=1620701 RepID=UPI003D6E339B
MRDSTSKDQAVAVNLPPLKRIRHPIEILYLSAIAHRIAPQYGVAATEVATELAQIINHQHGKDWNPNDHSAAIWQGITVQVTTNQDLLFQIHDRAIAVWLNHLMPPLLPLLPPPSPLSTNPFPWQYAHARCCSLLRLADRTGLITLHISAPDPSGWQWLEPYPLGWLTPTGQLYPHQAAERQLISQICTVFDQWAEARSLTSKLLMQQAEQLAQSVQAAHRAYPIWGDRSSEARDRQAAHLGLLWITQQVLQSLLNSLGIPAPTEL